MWAIILFIVTLVIDQLTKYFIQTQVALHNVTVIENFFSITYARNTGAAWSMFTGKTALLALISAVAVGGMLWYLIYRKPKGITKYAIVLMASGAMGNLIDRLFLGYVRDFLDFIIFGYDFPIFNIADSALCIGVFLLVISTLKEEE